METYNISEIISFQIFDKFGNVIFTSKKLNEGWDGKVEGELQKSETYFYYVRAKTILGKEITKTGSVYLINKYKR